MTRRTAVIVSVLAVAAALAYLRDPPWLSGQASGLSAWQTDRAGGRFRWTRGHASFFVPAGWQAVELPLRATFDSPADWPIAATLSIDDRAADLLVFEDDRWRTVILPLPPPGSRRVRRIDIRLDRMRDEHRGIQLGEIRSR